MTQPTYSVVLVCREGLPREALTELLTPGERLEVFDEVDVNQESILPIRHKINRMHLTTLPVVLTGDFVEPAIPGDHLPFSRKCEEPHGIRSRIARSK